MRLDTQRSIFCLQILITGCLFLAQLDALAVNCRTIWANSTQNYPFSFSAEARWSADPKMTRFFEGLRSNYLRPLERASQNGLRLIPTAADFSNEREGLSPVIGARMNSAVEMTSGALIMASEVLQGVRTLESLGQNHQRAVLEVFGYDVRSGAIEVSAAISMFNEEMRYLAQNGATSFPEVRTSGFASQAFPGGVRRPGPLAIDFFGITIAGIASFDLTDSQRILNRTFREQGIIDSAEAARFFRQRAYVYYRMNELAAVGLGVFPISSTQVTILGSRRTALYQDRDFIALFGSVGSFPFGVTPGFMGFTYGGPVERTTSAWWMSWHDLGSPHIGSFMYGSDRDGFFYRIRDSANSRFSAQQVARITLVAMQATAWAMYELSTPGERSLVGNSRDQNRRLREYFVNEIRRQESFRMRTNAASALESYERLYSVAARVRSSNPGISQRDLEAALMRSILGFNYLEVTIEIDNDSIPNQPSRTLEILDAKARVMAFFASQNIEIPAEF